MSLCSLQLLMRADPRSWLVRLQLRETRAKGRHGRLSLDKASAAGPARLSLCVKLVCDARGSVTVGGKSKGNVLEVRGGAGVRRAAVTVE